MPYLAPLLDTKTAYQCGSFVFVLRWATKKKHTQTTKRHFHLLKQQHWKGGAEGCGACVWPTFCCKPTFPLPGQVINRSCDDGRAFKDGTVYVMMVTHSPTPVVMCGKGRALRCDNDGRCVCVCLCGLQVAMLTLTGHFEMSKENVKQGTHWWELNTS